MKPKPKAKKTVKEPSKTNKDARKTAPQKSSSAETKSDPSGDNYKHLASEIKKWLSLDPPPPKPIPEPSPTDIAVIAAALSAASGGQSAEVNLEAAIDLWKAAAETLESRDRGFRIDEAVRKLIFKNGEESVTRDVFLLRLLPKDSVKKRKEFMTQAIGRFSMFFIRFRNNGEGWPKGNLASLLNEEPDDFAPREVKIFLKQTENGVNFKTARAYAPFILAWRDMRSDPRTRGSKGQRKRTAAPTEEPSLADGA